ncbi:Endoplasmic reticulum, protein Pkr1 [Cordyceps fumosorosea ARSEF 2679]|uniref:Endoplasmic reticulum, protein Pkr1 n=1 Tax=Cordyceps fumosorosea (strain ARSEF 2679) TaxID=1081104 RepID=A0A168E863_CORFA|nr:Endoplasmic reticulum, protein Pkr1 [Cordyceps fumosorosea ARSEF 2679]OAA73488.1 Endoplasmic reticulum, protein Pkr1 [Cordyceps fumosorosea ARSEF 2679]
MSSFIVDLWESIFVPGPTPTILRATNASFAALQVTLLALLVATYSVHFVVLSVLSAGLWWSVNWFAAELAAAKARGELPSSGDPADETKTADDGGGGPTKDGSDDEDTEVEGRPKGRQRKGRKSAGKGGGGVARVAKSSADVEAVEAKGTLKHRVAASPVSDSTGCTSQSSVSTEDEWEKVSENENDKTK